MKPAPADAPTTIDAYIDAAPADVQPTLHALRKLVRAAAPTAVERISYRMPTFTMKKNIFHFAAFKSHIGIYPGPAAIVEFAARLTDYQVSKGTVQLPLDRPLPRALITAIVRFNVAREQAAAR